MTITDAQTTRKAGHVEPRLLIEEWLPAAAIGVECVRERATGQQPPTARMHVWWARRPLVASRAAVLASVLPADFDRRTFERLLGFYGPSEQILQGQELLDWAKVAQRKIPNPHGPRAFSNTLPETHLEAASKAWTTVWSATPRLLDHMSGGGSIPLEAARLGLNVVANEYQPVACSVLEATVDYPLRFGADLAQRARHWGAMLRQRFIERVEQFFPQEGTFPDYTYLYARTVPCPYTGHITPLVPDWHLSKPDNGTAVVAVPAVNRTAGTWGVSIESRVRKDKRTSGAPRPTYNKGSGRSLFSEGEGRIDSEYIKAMAQAVPSKLGSELFAVVLKKAGGFDFRPATQADRDAITGAEKELMLLRPKWERDNIIPTEQYPRVTSELRPILYGMPGWADMFSPRQLLCMGVLVEELRRLRPSILDADGQERGEAIEHLLALGIDKFANHASILASWDPGTYGIRSVFDRHDFSFKPTPAEMAPCGAEAGLAWAIENVLEAYEKISRLPRAEHARPVSITLGSATNLPNAPDESVSAVVVDPPYADNVQYSELADFFYVWLKRTQGHRRPEWFSTYLSPNTEEAVVNAVRHISDFDPSKKYPTGTKKAAKQEAEAFYRKLMTDSFKEAKRVLRDDGVLTVMFTHKQQSAWEALFGSLIDAGFLITATWPVRTESPHSLHIAAKNAAESTVILVARKRPAGAGVGYFDQEMRDEIRRAATTAADRLRQDGLNAIDQLVGSFGPAMEVFSRYNEVKLDTGAVVGVGEAIDEASDAVAKWREAQLMARGSGAELAGIEPLGRFAVLAWDVLAAAQFRFNEAKLLGHAIGLSPEDLVKAGLAKKESQNIRLLSASERRRAAPLLATDTPNQAELRQIHPNDASVRSSLDGCHMLALAYAENGRGAAGIGAARQLANRHGFRERSQVARLMQALVLAAPRGVQVAGKGIADKYPEFLAWHALLQPLFGIEPPDWSEQEPLQPLMAGFGKAMSETDEEEPDEEDEEDAEEEEDV